MDSPLVYRARTAHRANAGGIPFGSSRTEVDTGVFTLALLVRVCITACENTRGRYGEPPVHIGLRGTPRGAAHAPCLTSSSSLSGKPNQSDELFGIERLM